MKPFTNSFTKYAVSAFLAAVAWPLLAFIPAYPPIERVSATIRPSGAADSLRFFRKTRTMFNLIGFTCHKGKFMKNVQTIADVYPAIDELIIELRTVPKSKLADILHHRMHMVAWTSGSELLEDLQNVFTDTLQSSDVKLPAPIENQIQRIMHVIKRQA